MITAADGLSALGLDEQHRRVVEQLITEATATLGRELGRYLGPPKQVQDVLCGGQPPGHGMVMLTEDPLEPTEAMPFTVATRYDRLAAYEDLELADWELEGRMLHAVDHFPHGRGAIRVTYWAGFLPGQGPPELMDLVRRLLVMKWGQRTAGTDTLLQSESIGDYSYSRGDAQALDGWQSIVQRWRRRLV